MLDDRIMWVLQDIERGEEQVTPLVAPHAVYCGWVPYRTSSGWILTVFNDCYEWDYLAAAESPAGERLEYQFMSDALQDYVAPEDQWDSVWSLFVAELPNGTN